MSTFYGPICPTFRAGPDHVISYDTILAPTVVHGPSVPEVLIGDELPIINHFSLPPDVAAIAPPLIKPDDTDTWEGRVIHYNRIRMIAASILYHHGADRSFSQLAREKVRHDMNLVLSFTPEMVMFIAEPNGLTYGTINYPPFLEAEWIGSFPDSDYTDVVVYTGDVIGPRISDESVRVFGPQTFLDYLVDNRDERYEVLERLENHRYAYETSGNAVLLAWANKAIDCWHKHMGILRMVPCVRYVPEVDKDAPKFDFGIEYPVVAYNHDDLVAELIELS
jgi:hypothetical protein